MTTTLREGSGSSNFTIATNNVLFEPYYQRHCKVEKVQYKDRLASWVALTASIYFRSFDVVLLQEFPFKDEDWVGPLHAAGYSLLPGALNASEQDASAIAFRCDRFQIFGAGVNGICTFKDLEKLRDSKSVSFLDYGDGYTAVRALLQTVDGAMSIYCVSAHAPSARTPLEKKEVLERILGLATEELNGTDCPLFVGGDFNIDALTPWPLGDNGGSSPRATPVSFPSRVFDPSTGWWELSTGIRWTHYGARGPSQLDYLFARWPAVLGNPLKPRSLPSQCGEQEAREFEVNSLEGQKRTLLPEITSSVYPTNPLDLILHGPVLPSMHKAFLSRAGYTTRRFHSDHAMVACTISLEPWEHGPKEK